LNSSLLSTSPPRIFSLLSFSLSSQLLSPLNFSLLSTFLSSHLLPPLTFTLLSTSLFSQLFSLLSITTVAPFYSSPTTQLYSLLLPLPTSSHVFPTPLPAPLSSDLNLFISSYSNL
jgi:hypothetical protein